MRKTTLLLLCMIFTTLVYARQEEKAPYFQQRVDNTIRVALDDVSHILRGDITIHYTNNSPDTLGFIFFHLWPNAYSHDQSAYNRQAVENRSTDFYLSSKLDWGYIDSLSFTVDSEPSGLVPTDHKDVVKLILNDPLIPGETIKIHTPFYIQIPKTFSRLGHHGQSYQITQWFPKPAVYDRDGWHPMPYLDQGEFYSEFGSYDVSITLPENYIVMATGNLQTPEEIAFLDSLSRVSPDTAGQQAHPETPASSSRLKTIRYTEDHVHDFAWFADKRWVVRKGDIRDSLLNIDTEAWSAFYPEHSTGWQNSIDYLTKAIKFYSEEIGPYPYKTVKAVEGPLIAGGGMEYPTVTIIIPSDDPDMVETIIVHEVGHNWFYGILANNERDHPWLDESINSYYENKLLRDKKTVMSVFEVLPFLYSSNAHLSQPLTAHSASFTHLNYGADIYQRGAKAFEWLNAYIGEDAFKRAVQALYKSHQFKHIGPDDFRQAFSAQTEKNLDWFFDGYLSSSRPVDFKINAVKKENDSVFVSVKNKTKVLSPAILDVEWINDSHVVSRYRYLTDPFTQKYTLGISLPGHTLHTLKISETIPDVQKHNNVFKNGKFRHFRIVPLSFLNISEYKNAALSPALGYNENNGFMLGLLTHNISIPSHRFQFGLAPLYSFQDRTVYGTGFLNYTHFTPESKWLHNIDFHLAGKSFGMYSSRLNTSRAVTSRYIKISPEIIVHLRKPYPRSPVDRQISLKAYLIQEQAMEFIMDAADSLYHPHTGPYSGNNFLKLSYSHHNRRTFNPYSLNAEAQLHRDFIKLSIEGELKVDYHYNNSGMNIRTFIGKMIPASPSSYDHYRYRYAGTFSADNDYLYDHTILSRGHNTGLGAQQIHIREGGMKIPTLMYARPLGLSDNFIGSINLSSDIPVKGLPVKIFADIMTFSDAKTINTSGSAFLWDAGFEVDLWGVGSIYIPVLYSQDYKDYVNSVYSKNKFLKTITFTINFNQIKWQKPIETIPLLRKFF